MRTVYIMVEGPTEEEFVNNSVAHHLRDFGILNTVPIPILTSQVFYGGDITFARYRANAQNLLRSDPKAIVTSLIDYYELRTDFPGYTTAMAKADKHASVAYIEQEVLTTIANDRLIPYIQLHEFEGLLFSDIKGFQTYFPSLVGHAQYIINHNPNPEMINDNPATAPSARLKEIFRKISKRYKNFTWSLDCFRNGINPVLAKCPRFKN